MAALAANAVKNQRKKAAKNTVDQALHSVNEQRLILNHVAVKHRDSLSSVSTLDSYRPEVNKKALAKWRFLKDFELFSFSAN